MEVKWKTGPPPVKDTEVSNHVVVKTDLGNISTGYYIGYWSDWSCDMLLLTNEKVVAWLEGLTLEEDHTEGSTIGDGRTETGVAS